MLIAIPQPALVLLVGPSGSGKSTFARRHFLPTEIVSSDHCRALICDDQSNQSVTSDAFDLLRLLIRKRLRHQRLVVVDATNLLKHARSRLVALAFHYNVPCIAIVFDADRQQCSINNDRRPDRKVDENVIATQFEDLHRAKQELAGEGFTALYVVEQPDSVLIQRDSSALLS